MLYVDPSAGSLALQVAAAALFTGVITVKRWWATAAGAARRALARLRR
jgi:hypothetical protein